MQPTFQLSISTNGNTLTVTDTSPWGGANPLRNTRALKLLALRKLSTGDVEIAPNVYTPETIEDFLINVTNLDAVYEIYMFSLVLYTGQGLVNGDIYYDPNDFKIKKVITGVLTEITLASLIAEVTVERATTFTLILTKISISRDNIELILLTKLQAFEIENCEINEYYTAQRNFNYVRTLRSGALIEFARGNYINAELNIESGNAFADNLLAEA